MLQHCVADGKKWLRLDLGSKPDDIKEHLLVNPSEAELESAIQHAGQYVLSQKDRGHWKGGGISIWYSGHGEEQSGAWSLRDTALDAGRLLELLTPIGHQAGGSLGLELGMDSCHSGAFFAYLMEKKQQGPIVARDMYVSCLPDEVAWEMDTLGHGALAYTLFHPGNAHVDHNRLALAVRQGDEAYIRMATHSFVPNPVTYLTEGDQHSFELVSGHEVDVKGAGRFDLTDAFSAKELISKLATAGNAQPGEDLSDKVAS